MKQRPAFLPVNKGVGLAVTQAVHLQKDKDKESKNAEKDKMVAQLDEVRTPRPLGRQYFFVEFILSI